jgi:hypothetical protein
MCLKLYTQTEWPVWLKIIPSLRSTWWSGSCKQEWDSSQFIEYLYPESFNSTVTCFRIIFLQKVLEMRKRSHFQTHKPNFPIHAFTISVTIMMLVSFSCLLLFSVLKFSKMCCHRNSKFIAEMINIYYIFSLKQYCYILRVVNMSHNISSWQRMRITITQEWLILCFQFLA